MATLKQAYDNWNELYKMVEILAVDAMQENSDNAIESIKEQLWDGKTGKGNDIRPYYSEDPWFKSRAKAEAYKRWKQAITPNPNRNPDAPNLFINGWFYKQISIQKNDDELLINPGAGSLIKEKYDDIFILQIENQKEFNDLTRPIFFRKVRKLLNYGR